MKKESIFLIGAMMLVACGNNKSSASSNEESEDTSSPVDSIVIENVMPQYDITDAMSMGINGNIQSVILQSYSTYESNGELKDGSQIGRCDISFNPSGQITNDEWDNEYGYKSDGSYYRGNHTYTSVKRDKGGRIIEYNDIEPNKDNESNFTQSFQYDKNGRIISINYSGWSSLWTEKRHYDKGNIYPSKMERSMTFEGGGAEETVVTYRYTKFDNHNNWTERLCMVSTKEMEDEPVDSIMPQQVKLNEEIQVEKRTISYFE